MCLYDVVTLFGTAESFTALNNICLFVLEIYEFFFFTCNISFLSVFLLYSIYSYYTGSQLEERLQLTDAGGNMFITT